MARVREPDAAPARQSATGAATETDFESGNPNSQSHEPLAILAGSGRAPLEVACAAETAERPVHIVGIEGVADAEIMQFSHDWAGLGQVARLTRSLKRTGARELVIIGGLKRPDLWRLRIDSGFIRNLPLIFGILRGGDDAVLRRVAGYFEGEGLTVVGIRDAAPALLAGDSPIAGPEPTAELDLAATRASAALEALSGFDIGQACLANRDGVLAFEDGAGTADLVSRYAARSTQHGEGAVLVKLPKTGQDLRLDLPAIGPDTIVQAQAAGLKAIYVAAGASIVLDREAVARAAAEAAIAVVGLPWTPKPQEARQLAKPNTDATRARAILDALAPHLAPATRDVGAFVRNGHVYALVRDGAADGVWPDRLAKYTPRAHLGVWPVKRGALAVRKLDSPPDKNEVPVSPPTALTSLAERKRIASLDVYDAAALGTASTIHNDLGDGHV
jgi:DUF1009 family protein